MQHYNIFYHGPGMPPRPPSTATRGVQAGDGGESEEDDRAVCEKKTPELLMDAGGGDDSGQPTMMSFKAFLGSQDDTITDEEAIKKYAEYKLEFKRQQLNEFFVSHKDEEW